MESLWRSSCWNPCHCQDDNFNDTKKSNKLWPHLIWAPVVKRSMGVSPPKGAIPSPFLPAHFHLFSHQLNFLRGPLGPRAPGTCPSYLPLSVGLIRRLFSCWNLRNRKPQWNYSLIALEIFRMFRTGIPLYVYVKELMIHTPCGTVSYKYNDLSMTLSDSKIFIETEHRRGLF